MEKEKHGKTVKINGLTRKAIYIRIYRIWKDNSQKYIEEQKLTLCPRASSRLYIPNL